MPRGFFTRFDTDSVDRSPVVRLPVARTATQDDAWRARVAAVRAAAHHPNLAACYAVEDRAALFAPFFGTRPGHTVMTLSEAVARAGAPPRRTEGQQQEAGASSSSAAAAPEDEGELHDFLRRRRGLLPWHAAIRIARCVAAAIAALHVADQCHGALSSDVVLVALPAAGAGVVVARDA